MAKKLSSSRGPARKTPAQRTWFAKGEYYPKVDLSDLEDRLMSSWSPASVGAPAEAAIAPAPRDQPQFVVAPVLAATSTREEEDAMPPPVAISQPPRAPPPLGPVVEPSRTAVAAPRSPKDPLRLPTSLDIAAARPLAKSLLARRGQPIQIDASAVSQVGAQCAQVLLSAKRTWDADGVSLSMVNCGPRMIEDFALIGIDCRTLATGESPK
jgi:anti-anti-sigma regulatory factor